MEFIIGIIVFYILFRFVSKSKLDKTSKLAILSFIAVWSCVVFLTIWNPGSMYPVGWYTFVLVYLNVICFTLGFFVIKTKKKHSTTEEGVYENLITGNIERVINNFFFKAVLIIAVIYTTRLLMTNYQVMIINESLSEVRDSYFDDADALYGSGFTLIRDWFLNPFSKLAIPIFAYMLYKKRNWVCVLLGVFLFEYGSLSGGRFGYAAIAAGIIFVIVCVLYFEDRRRKVYLLSILGGVFFVLMLSITLFRAGVMQVSKAGIEDSSDDLTTSFAIYTTGPIGALDYSIKNDYVSKVGGHTYGVATFCAIDRFVQPFLKVINPQRLPLSNKFIGYKQENMIRIFDTFGSYNALYTSILFFYVDFGFLGVIILPILLGYLYRLLFVMFRKRPTVPLLVLLTWMYDITLHSVFDLSLISHMHVIMIIALLWLHSKTKIQSIKSLS